MIINYSAHSLERIRERELSKEKVEIVISNPDSLVQIEELKKALSNLMISVVVVVYEEINNIPFIITAYRSTDSKMYLK